MQESSLTITMGWAWHKQCQARARDTLAEKAITVGTGTGAGEEDMRSGTAGSSCCWLHSSRNVDEGFVPKACYSTMSKTSNPPAKRGALSPSPVTTM